jgi:predicted permease
MLSDLRYAIRSLASRPLVSGVAVVSLSLGIGVNTAIFSLLDTMALRRLPVPAPSELVVVTSPGPRPGSVSTSDSGGNEAVFSYPLFRDLEAMEPAAIRVAAHRDFGASVGYGGSTSEAEGLLVSSHYFSALRLAPAVGRLLGPEDNRTPGAHPVVVLSHDFWTTRFGAHPGVVGERLILNGEPVTVVGVAPAGFFGMTALDRPQVFLPLSMTGHVYRVAVADSQRLTDRGDHWLYVFGRLAPGVDRDALQARLNPRFSGILNNVELPELSEKMREPAREAFARRQLLLEDGSRVRNAARDEVSIIVALLFAVTGFVLAIACANVANLLLVRAVDRSGEIALRVSLGASRGRLLRMLLVESLLIGVTASALSLGVAKLTIAVVLTMMPAEDVPMYEMALNTSVLLFALVVGLGTSVLFGLFPALHGLRHATAAALHAQSHRASGGRSVTRFRAATATVQVALATALLAVAGLFAASLVNVGAQELGIRRDGLVAFRVTPSINGYTTPRAEALFAELDQELRGVPGVTSVSASTVPILADSNWRNFVTVEGFEPGSGPDVPARVSRVGLGYFSTVGIRMLQGRDFTSRDTRDAPKVAIVNEAFVRQFNLRDRAIGSRMALGRDENIALDIEIVGVVADAKYSEVRAPAPPQFFMPYGQADTTSLTFYVRTASSADALVGAIPAVVRRLDPNLPIANLRTMDDQIRDNTTRERVMSVLSAMFAGLATVLAVVGLYAMLAYSVSQRVREIGIRIALGAQGGDIRRLVASQIVRVGAVGGVIGVALAIGLGRLGQSMFVGVERLSGPIVVAAALVAFLAVAVAGVLPARRAARVDPVEILR